MNNQINYVAIVQRAKNLITAISQDTSKTAEDRLFFQNFVVEKCVSFSEYVVTTNNYIYTVHSISESRKNGDLSQEEFERKLNTVDQIRRSKHNIIIDSCNQLNRLCNTYQIEPICPFDTKDRYQVADFAANMSLVVHGYAINHNYTMDEVITQLDKDTHLFNTKNIFEQMERE